MDIGELLWEPAPARAGATNLAGFARAHGFDPSDYRGLWEWSVRDLEAFWAAVWDDAGITAKTPYERVLGARSMPGAEWFPGARLSYAENLLARGADDHVALIGAGEGRPVTRTTYAELRASVGSLQRGLATLGVTAGDRIAAVVPNCPEAVELMLATTASGAVWTSCSPDFGAQGVLDRFSQVGPRVLVVADGYRYGGRRHDMAPKVAALVEALDTVETVVVISYAEGAAAIRAPGATVLDVSELAAAGGAGAPRFAPVAPNHPLYIMYSSGTTGVPKSIVHGHGGTLVNHAKEHRYHTDLVAGRDTIFWFTTCGWMMWNWLVSALAQGVTVVCYDGSPTWPDAGALWRLADEVGVTHFGTSPRFLHACAAAGLTPSAEADLSGLTSVLSTGSPLNPEQFDWVYEAVGADLHLASVSGGTDILGCFAGGVPTLGVRRGELQGPGLGMAVAAWDTAGHPVGAGHHGELVCTEPFPSMPVGFWGDADGSRYRAAYFSDHPGVWTHGDWIEPRPSGGLVIHGRSDTTLNPGGVRIGTAEIYRAVEQVDGIADSVVVGRPVDGDSEVVLFVVCTEGRTLDDELAAEIRRTIRSTASPRHVPARIVAVPAVPYTISGKKVEVAVGRLITGQAVDNRDALADPSTLDAYAAIDWDSDPGH